MAYNTGRVLLCLCIVFCSSCNRKPDNLEAALRLAGANRPELEKVLAHYRQKPEDRLKYRAAVFLIENMPGHYAMTGKGLAEYRRTLRDFALRNDYPVVSPDIWPVVFSDVFEDRCEPRHFPFLDRVYDIKVITAEYLIENIDLSFETWQRASWGKQVSFADFCEYILPYRTGNEPIENWRQAYHDNFQPVLDSLLRSDDPVEAGRLLYDTIFNRLWIFDYQVTELHFGALSLLESRFGDCRLMADYAAYVFRSVGIPSGVDCLLQNPVLHGQHYWNFMKDASGKTVPFELYQLAPAHDAEHNYRKKGKVYRTYYSKQSPSPALRYKDEKRPPIPDDPYLTDVSADYFEGVTAVYKTIRRKETGNLLYIGVFNNRTWIPVTCSGVRRGRAVFRNLDTCVVYQALTYTDDGFVPFSVPFVAMQNGRSHFLYPDADNLLTMYINRKYPLPEWLDWYRRYSVGGQFQGANRIDFSDAVTLFTVTHELDMNCHRVPVDNPKEFKYLRYFSAPGSHCNMAEIQFFCDGEELTGEVIGTEGSAVHQVEFSKYAVFDKDPVTYYNAIEADGAWVGLALDRPTAVMEIEYQFRCDDNGIREGDVYELFYFTTQGKVSQGKQIGTKDGVLTYENVPSNALYLLHNETRGREERIFTYENGKQTFY